MTRETWREGAQHLARRTGLLTLSNRFGNKSPFNPVIGHAWLLVSSDCSVLYVVFEQGTRPPVVAGHTVGRDEDARHPGLLRCCVLPRLP